MVEITEQSSERHSSSATTFASHNSTTNAPATVTVIDFVRNHLTDSALFLTRLVTIFCSLCYALSLGTPAAQHTTYAQALFSAAATNALRLHQRVGAVQFSQRFFFRVFAEDAWHYLVYSLLLLGVTPVTMALLPVFLFAILKAASYIVSLCIATGNGNTFISKKLQGFTASQTSNFLGVVACSEIFMMFLFIAMTLSRKDSIFLPFLYYRFLVLRYTSRRNPTTRQVFQQLRVLLENAVLNPNCPQVVRNGAFMFINFLCRLCPEVA